MRILMLAASLGASLFAQAPAEQPTDPATQWEQTRKEIKGLLKPKPMQVILPNRFAGLVSSKLLVTSAQTCAIPLLDVLPKGRSTGDPKIVIPRSGKLPNLDHMPIVHGLPSCADVKP